MAPTNIKGNVFVVSDNFPNKIAGAAYEKSVIATVEKIRKSPFGAAVFDLFSAAPKKIFIAAAPNKDVADAHARNATDAFEAGKQFFNAAGEEKYGTGAGSDVVIDFNPAGNFRGMGADATLLHEMTHAWRQARGKWNTEHMTRFVNPEAFKENPGDNPDLKGRKMMVVMRLEDTRFENWEEFIAVVVEGIYRAQTGATSVRKSHGDTMFNFAYKSDPKTPNVFNPMPMTDSQLFAERYRPALIKILNDDQEFYKILLKADAWFNPVRDMAGMAAYKRQAAENPPTLPSSSGIFSSPLGSGSFNPFNPF